MNDNQKAISTMFIGLSILVMLSCGGSLVRKQALSEVPDVKYQRIIKLDNPDGQPDRTLAGLVHVTGRATVCTDYPREVMIQGIDDLTFMERQAFPFFLNYVIQDGQETIGYVSIPVDYRIVVWRREEDPQCQYKIQIILPERSMGHSPHIAVDTGISSW